MIGFTKKFAAFLAAAFLALCAPMCVFAQAGGVLTDEAGLFTSLEQTELQSSLDDLSEKTGWTAVIYTNYNGCDSDEIFGNANRYYADNYGKTTSGVMLTVDMGGRSVDFCTKGGAMEYFSDSRVDAILDDVQDYLSDGEYYSAATAFIDGASYYFDEGIPEGESNENIERYEKEDNPFLYVVKHYGIIILAVALGVAALAVVFVKHSYKHNGQENIYDLHSNSKTSLTNSEDIFINKSVAVTRISESSSTGGSGSHHSSGGGGSRGGGSRSF